MDDVILQREIRGIPCDVWVAESLPTKPEDKYSTIELYFSRPDYHILVEEVNSLSQLPLGMRTYLAESVMLISNLKRKCVIVL